MALGEIMVNRYKNPRLIGILCGSDDGPAGGVDGDVPVDDRRNDHGAVGIVHLLPSGERAGLSLHPHHPDCDPALAFLSA